MNIRNSTIVAVMAAIYGIVLGFAYGNLFEVEYGIHFKDWQTLAGVLVAVAAATLAFVGVQGTQRINVVIREQDRLDALLPGLRQANELLLVIRGSLSVLRNKSLHQAAILLDSAIPVSQNESVEQVVRRKLPLADDHLKREVAEIVFALRRQAELLKIGKEEVERYKRDIANIHTFAPDQHEGLRDIGKQVEASHNRESDEMWKLVETLDRFADLVKGRIAGAEERRKKIRGIVDKFFRDD